MENLYSYSSANANSNENRTSVRYLIRGMVWFQWRTMDGNWCDGVGAIREIGNTGVFVQCESMPPVASVVRLIVVLPDECETDTPICLSGLGHVRHVLQEPRQTSGFGASAVFLLRTSMSAA